MCIRDRRVGAPLAVLIDEPADVLAPDRAVQGADHADVERGGLLEQGLHLSLIHICHHIM